MSKYINNLNSNRFHAHDKSELAEIQTLWYIEIEFSSGWLELQSNLAQ